MRKAKIDSPAIKADLAVLEALPDEDIDTSDIPEGYRLERCRPGEVLSSSEKEKSVGLA